MPLASLSRHVNMSRIRGKNTSPELKVRRWLHGQGFRFRVNVRRLPGTPDIVLAKYRTCIFVNGCFWHGHDGCRSYTHPKTNPEFWEEKVARNKMRECAPKPREMAQRGRQAQSRPQLVAARKGAETARKEALLAGMDIPAKIKSLAEQEDF